MTDKLDGDMKLVTFFLDGKLFAASLESLVEIREWEVPTPLPGVPSWTMGVLNLRGQVVPIVDLGERIGWGKTQIHGRSCVLVMKTGGGKHAGFLVEDVDDIATINSAEIRPAPAIEGPERELVSGLVQVAPRSRDARSGETQMASILAIEELGITRVLETA